MSFVGGSLKFILDDPVGELIIVEQFALPAIRKAVPEQTKHVGDDHSQQGHLNNVHDRQNRAIIGNLVITVLVAVAALEEVEHLLLGNKAGGS